MDYFFGQGNVVPSLGPSESGHIVLGNDVERAFIVTNQQQILLLPTIGTGEFPTTILPELTFTPSLNLP